MSNQKRLFQGLINSDNQKGIPLFLPMRFDVMFREESRFQTKRENKRKGDTNKCSGKFGIGQTTSEIGLMTTNIREHA